VLYKDELIALQCFIPNNASFQIQILQLGLFQILVYSWLGEEFPAIELLIWSYYTFSKYLSVWGRVLFNDDHKTKHRSWL